MNAAKVSTSGKMLVSGGAVSFKYANATTENAKHTQAASTASAFTLPSSGCFSADSFFMAYNGRAERRARRCMRLALYPSRVRSSEVLGGTGATAAFDKPQEDVWPYSPIHSNQSSLEVRT